MAGNEWADKVVDALNRSAGDALKVLAYRSRWAELRELPAERTCPRVIPATGERCGYPLRDGERACITCVHAAEYNRASAAHRYQGD